MGGLALDYLVPPHDLAPYVSTFYRFAADVPALDDLERADRAQLRFRLSPGPGSYRFARREQPAPARHFLGPTTAAIRTRAAGPVLVFGLGLTPAGWNAMLGVDASLVLDRVLDADPLLGPDAADLARALERCPDAGAMVKAALGPVRAWLARGAEEPRAGEAVRFSGRVDAWLSGDPSPCIEALAAMTGLSRRQVERRCNALYGAPPKLLARKYRALRAAAALAAGDEAWEQFLADGFYDQSHMIREVRRFAGQTPGQLRRDRSELQRATLSGRRALSGLVAPLVSDT